MSPTLSAESLARSWDLAGISPRRLAAALAPVLVAIGVSAHLHSASLTRSLAAVVVAISVQFLAGGAGPRAATGGGVRDQPAPRAGLLWLVPAAGLGIWLSLTSLPWLALPGALGLGALLGRRRLASRLPLAGFHELAGLVLAELAAGWGTVLAELDRLPVLGLLAVLMPAALAASLLLITDLEAIHDDLSAGRLTLAVAVGGRGARQLLGILLGIAVVVPLVITLTGLAPAEAFLPWLAAPLAEGPLRSSTSPDRVQRAKASRQMTLLLVAASALLALGVWAG